MKTKCKNNYTIELDIDEVRSNTNDSIFQSIVKDEDLCGTLEKNSVIGLSL